VKREKFSSSSPPASRDEPAPDFAGRFQRFWHELEKRGMEGFLVTHAPNLFYLFNLSPSAGYAFCVDGQATLLVDGRYIEQANLVSVNCRPVRAANTLEEDLRDLLERQPGAGKRLGVEARHLCLATGRLVDSWETGWKLEAADDVLDRLRIVKEPSEILALEHSFRLAQDAYQTVQSGIVPGETELVVAGLFELELRNRGAEKTAFETIVASGPRSSMPHARASGKVIAEREFVLVDFGVQKEAYCSDLTRVHFPPGSLAPEIFGIVREAKEKALAAIRPGVSTTEVDAAARDHIRKQGYGDFFAHSTGHGLGLEVHEAPLVSWRAPTVIEEGMVFTIEPGIYLPGKYGIRLEDAVVVTADGCRLLSDPDR
jgi:Xaa-Pro aminopeptidase